MAQPNGYQYLEPRSGRFRQLFVKGRKYPAERLYRETEGEDARTPEQIARDFAVPVEAVREAIDYCQQHEDLLLQERREELARLHEYDLKYPPLMPPS
jgi:hypothetical protein